MQTIINKRQITLFVLMATLILPLIGIASKPPPPPPHNQGTVSDASSNQVRSDGYNGGTYVEGLECANVLPFATGFWQLRTVTNSGVCNGEISWWNINPSAPLPYIPGQGYHRFLTLDFSRPINGAPLNPGNVDGYNSGNPQQYAPARFVFDKAFSKNAKTTPAHIYVLKVNADGTTTQATAWDIEYRTAVPIVINPGGVSWTLALLTDSTDIADLYQITTAGSVFIGTYYMPFSVVTN